MKVDNTDFSQGFVEGFENEEAFLAEMESEGYKHAIFPNDKKREEKLKQVYQLHNPKKDKPQDKTKTDKPSKG